MLYQIRQGTVSLSGETILKHIDFYIKGKEKIGLIGRNGSGKTTLLRLIAGELSLDRDDKSPDSGIFMARDSSIGMLSQSVFKEEDLEKSVEELILSICPVKDPFSERYRYYMVSYQKMFTGLGFCAEDNKRKISSFSGGEQTRIGLIRLLLMEPDILLLDEPTNHLDLLAVRWLEEYLAVYPGAAVIVSHDRYFLDQTVEVIWEMSAGRLTRYAGNYSVYREEKRKILRIQEKKYQEQQSEIARLSALIEKYKHKPRKASMARSKRKVLERMEKIEKPAADEAHIFTGEILPKETGSKRVLTTEKLVIGYDTPLKEITLSVRRGQKIGIIGANGTGKTTFLRTIAAKQDSLSGKCQLGMGIHVGYFDQFSADISSNERVFEHFSKRFPERDSKDIRRILGHYLFTGEDAGKKIEDLSGGEKSRLILAELLTRAPNLLLLDEPTNHMDIPARETLESAFSSYRGTMLFISHDRYFVKEVASSLLIFEDERVMYYPFGYDHYQEYLKKQRDRQSGVSITIEAENTRIVQELHAVPDRRKIQGARFSQEQSYTDWQLSLTAKSLDTCRNRLQDLMDEKERALESAEYWKGYLSDDSREEKEWNQTFETAMNEYHQTCLRWYDSYIDYQEAFASYRD